jgi:uncharacterized protein
MRKAILFLFVAGAAASPKHLSQAQPASTPELEGQSPVDFPPGDVFHPGRTKSLLVVPRTPGARFRMSVIDAHSHAYGETPEAVAEWVRLQDRVGVRSSLILTNATGAEFLRLKALYADAHPGRFAMLAGFDGTNPDAADYGERLRRGVREAAQAGAVGLGELTDKGLGLVRDEGGAYFVDDPRFDPLWDEAGRQGLPVFFHIAEPAAFYEPPDETNELRRSGNWSLFGKGTPGFANMLERFERTLSRHPGTRFVAVHAFNLANDLAGVGRLLDRHENVQVDFAARMWELARQPYSARRFFTRYADRILFGTDNDPEPAMYLAHARQLETEDEWFWPADAEWWRGYGMDLPKDVLRKVYVTNAEKLLARRRLH